MHSIGFFIIHFSYTKFTIKCLLRSLSKCILLKSNIHKKIAITKMQFYVQGIANVTTQKKNYFSNASLKISELKFFNFLQCLICRAHQMLLKTATYSLSNAINFFIFVFSDLKFTIEHYSVEIS